MNDPYYQIAMDDWREAEDIDLLPEPVRQYIAAHVMCNEVAIGSFGQYFYNGYCEDLRHALDGLRACGAAEALDLARRVVALFGPAGPARSSSDRMEQLEAIDDGDIVRLSDAFLAIEDDTRECLRLFAERHRSSFGVRR